MVEQLVNIIKKHFYSPLGLIAGTILFIIVVILQIDSFVEKGIRTFFTRIILYLVIYVILVLLWFILLNYFPKKKKDRIGVVIAIRTENEREKLLIKDDFVEGLKGLLKENGLLSLFHIMILQDLKAGKAGDILENYTNKRNDYICKDILIHFNRTKENKKYNKLNNRINGHFYIWGTIKKRHDVQPKYFITLDALVVHRPIPLNVTKNIADDFRVVMPNKISFYESLEVKGFEMASSSIFIAIRYITGIAALISGDIFTAYKLHNGLQNEINKCRAMLPNPETISEKLNGLILLELVLQARYFYLVKHDYKIYNKFLDEAEKLNDKDYLVLILNSVRAFKMERDPIKSLKYLRIARRVSKGDYTWLYNKAFIYMYLEKFELGYSDYKKLRGISLPGEESIVDECIKFNEELLKSEPSKKQSIFILGYLYYIKKENLPMALTKFEMFIEETKNEAKYECLVLRTRTFLDEIYNRMGLKKT